MGEVKIFRALWKFHIQFSLCKFHVQFFNRFLQMMCQKNPSYAFNYPMRCNFLVYLSSKPNYVFPSLFTFSRGDTLSENIILTQNKIIWLSVVPPVHKSFCYYSFRFSKQLRKRKGLIFCTRFLCQDHKTEIKPSGYHLSLISDLLM